MIAVTVEFLVMCKVAFRCFDSFSMLLLPFFWPLDDEDNVNAQLHEWLHDEYLLPGTEFFAHVVFAEFVLNCHLFPVYEHRYRICNELDNAFSVLQQKIVALFTVLSMKLWDYCAS